MKKIEVTLQNIKHKYGFHLRKFNLDIRILGNIYLETYGTYSLEIHYKITSYWI